MGNTGYQCAACGSTKHDPAYCERCFRVICMGCIVKFKDGRLSCMECADFYWEACTCDECVENCCIYPCWPTPDEARKLIEAGYGNRLWEDYWVWERYDNPYGDIYILAPAVEGKERGRAKTGRGPCTFLSEDGRCEIHDIAKPMEARLTLCNNGSVRDIHRIVAFTWNNPEAQELVKEWRQDK